MWRDLGLAGGAAIAVVAAAASACGSKPPPPPPPIVRAPPPSPPPPPPPCVAVPDEDPGITRAVALSETRVGYCVGAGNDRCYALDLASGALEKLVAPPAAPAATAARMETTSPELKVCTADGCKTLTAKVMPGAAPLHAATNDAGAFAAVVLGDAESGKGYVEIWDVAAARRLAVVRYPRGSFRCGEPAFLGDTLLITARECAQPAARGALFTVKGRKIANVGGAEFGTYGDARVHVDGARWAFLGENGRQIALQDVVKGKPVKLIDTSALWKHDGSTADDELGNPGESALVALADGKLAVVAGSPANGSVATVDVATGAVTVTHAPLCAAP